MLIGRDAEMARIGGLLSSARQGRSGTVVIRGEAGVGKSALLQHALEHADGFTVLRGFGVDAESELAYAALHQLLRPVLDRIERLPAPQAAALRAAFALSDETVDERFRVSVGVLGLLAEVAEERPLLCLVDDAQWLDRASADALQFVARRLEAEPVALVIAARDDDENTYTPQGLPEVRLSPLSSSDSRRLLTQQLGRSAARGVVEWLVQNANGNPLALVELPATLTAGQLSGQDRLGGKLPATTTVEQVYIKRVAALPASTRCLLVLAAADETGERATIERAANEDGLAIGDLAAAELAGLLHVDSEQIVFRHPLVRSAVHRTSTFTEWEQAHRVLAVASAAQGNPDRAAWHQAAATVGTDDVVARALESTAERARLRSGHAAAASALQRAAELSTEDESRGRCLVAGAGAAWQAGQPDRATALLDRAGTVVTDPRLGAEVDNLRGVIGWRCGSVMDACTTLIAGAGRIAPLDSRKALEMLADAALSCWDAGDFARMAEAGRAAAALPRSDNPADALFADVLVGAVETSLGEASDRITQILDALTRARESEDPRLLIWAAIGAEMSGQHALESALLARAAQLARASGAVDRLIVALESITVQGFIAGDLAVAPEATEGLRLSIETGLPNAANLHRAALGWIAAVRGRGDECREHAATVVATARSNGHGIAHSIAEWAVALLDLATGRPDQTVTRLIDLGGAPPGIGHPFYVVLSAPDLVEACVRTGRPDRARGAFAHLEAFAQPGGPTWAMALAARCRALLGEGAAEEVEYTEALRLHREADNPIDRARTSLLFGEFLRRGRRKADAREHLRSALREFEALRAEPWDDRARSELRATGDTARKRDPSTFEELTPQELQIARLVADGHPNKAIAAQLFLSPRTVEYHLRKVFAKLAIASRAELIRHPVAAVRPALVS